MNATAFLVVAGSCVSTLVLGCASSGQVSSNGPRTACCCVVPPGASTTVDAQAADALRAAWQDERRVEAFYDNVMAKHGRVRPFVNIVHAEARHATVLASLMDRHGVPIPTADLSAVPAVPGTLRECNLQAAKLERENIALYDRLLADAKEPDIRAAFENLRAASVNNHLPAFERWAESTASAAPIGRGPGRGLGAGWAGGGRRGVCLLTQ